MKSSRRNFRREPDFKPGVERQQDVVQLSFKFRLVRNRQESGDVIILGHSYCGNVAAMPSRSQYWMSFFSRRSHRRQTIPSNAEYSVPQLRV